MNAFRRRGKAIHSDRRDWHAWLETHADLVVATGLPATAIETEDAWCYLINKGYSQAGYLGTDMWFDVGRMSPDQGAACLTLIEHWIAEHSTDLHKSTIRSLRTTYGPTQDDG